MKKYVITCVAVFLAIATGYSQTQTISITSPDKTIQVKCLTEASGQVNYTIQYKGAVVLEPSRLGVLREDGDFSTGLTLTGSSAVKNITDKYTLLTGKRSNITYAANQQTLHFKNASGQLADIIFQVSNDGVAFRYFFPGSSSEPKKIDSELTSFHLPAEATAWLQPM